MKSIMTMSDVSYKRTQFVQVIVKLTRSYFISVYAMSFTVASSNLRHYISIARWLAGSQQLLFTTVYLYLIDRKIFQMLSSSIHEHVHRIIWQNYSNMLLECTIIDIHLLWLASNNHLQKNGKLFKFIVRQSRAKLAGSQSTKFRDSYN